MDPHRSTARPPQRSQPSDSAPRRRNAHPTDGPTERPACRPSEMPMPMPRQPGRPASRRDLPRQHVAPLLRSDPPCVRRPAPSRWQELRPPSTPAALAGVPKPRPCGCGNMAGQCLRHMLGRSGLQSPGVFGRTRGRDGLLVGVRPLPSSTQTPERDALALAVHDTAHWVRMPCRHDVADRAIVTSLLKARMRRRCHRSRPLQCMFAPAGAARDDT